MRPLIHPALAGLTGKRRKREYQRLTRQALSARGLTNRGTPRIHVLNRPELQGHRGLFRKAAYKRMQYLDRYARGLTARGTERKLARYRFGFTGPMSPNELLWRAFRAEGEL